MSENKIEHKPSSPSEADKVSNIYRESTIGYYKSSGNRNKNQEPNSDFAMFEYALSRNLEIMNKFRSKVFERPFRFSLRLLGKVYYIIKEKDVFNVCERKIFEQSHVPTLIDLANSLHSDGKRAVIPGSVPVSGLIGGVKWSSGVCMVVASGDAGKTPLCKALAASSGEPYAVIRAGEPLAMYDTDPEDVAYNVISFLTSNYEFGVLDSIKDIIAMGGSLMKQGVSRQALIEVSSLSSLCCTLGKTLFVPFNVSSNDTEMMEGAIEMAKSNATSYLGLDSLSSSGSKWAGYMRSGEGQPRIRVSVDFSRTGSVKVMDEETASSSNSSSNFGTSDADSSINIELVRRVLPYNMMNR